MAEPAGEQPAGTGAQPRNPTPPKEQLQETLFQAGQGGGTELVSILRIDQQERWRRGDKVKIEDYLKTKPELEANTDGLLDLVLREVFLREEAGETPTIEEYVERFPQYEESLRRQFAVRQALREPGADLASLTSALTKNEPGGTAPLTRRVTITGYEVLSELGRGGMGVVYKAKQLALNRTVAIKMVLSGVHAGADGLARFRIEAEAAARLQHPNIVQIYEIGEQDGHPFFSLEYVEGKTLEEQFGGRPMKAREAALLIEKLARAMHAAHEKGIIHRDLKPANILIDPDGNPKITDFGLAKRLDSDTANTRTGDIMGTPNYMAPEQAAGRTRDIGPATDIYSLGAILYDLITGRPPFQGASLLDTLEQVRNQEPVPPRRFQLHLSADVETICLKCLEKDPAKRYPTALHLADDLRCYINNEPISARPIGQFERSWRWCRRNPALASVSALAIFAAIAALGFSINLAVTKSRAATETAAALARTREYAILSITESLRVNNTLASATITEILRQTNNDVRQTPEFPPIPGIIRCWGNGGKDPEQTGSTTNDWRQRLAQILTVQMENEPSRVFSSFIDMKGQVIERVESRNGKIVRASDLELDNVSKENYFVTGSKLKDREVYFSNVEVRTIKPSTNVVYCCTAVLDKEGIRHGVFVIAIDAKALLKVVEDMERRFENQYPESAFLLQVADNEGTLFYDSRTPVKRFAKDYKPVKPLKSASGEYDIKNKEGAVIRVGAYTKVFYNQQLDKNQYWLIDMNVPADLNIMGEHLRHSAEQ